MGYLKVDQMGKIYETSSDQADGSGFKGYAGESGWGDVTLGATYLKASQKQRNENIRNKKMRDIEDKQNEFIRMRNEANKIKKSRIARAEQELLDNTQYQDVMMKKALKADNSSEIRQSGGLSANGMSGFAGMTQSQQAIHQHMGTMGTSEARASHGISELEKQQAYLNAQADKQILAEARKLAERNKLEYKQLKASGKIASGQKRFLSAGPSFPQFKIK